MFTNSVLPNLTPVPALRTGLQRHAQLDSEHDYVSGAVVAAGIDNVLKIRLNVRPAKDIERVENFLDKFVGLYAETGTRMAGDVLLLGIPYVAGDAVITRCYTAGIVWSLRPRAPVVEPSERLKVLIGGLRIQTNTSCKGTQTSLWTLRIRRSNLLPNTTINTVISCEHGAQEGPPHPVHRRGRFWRLRKFLHGWCCRRLPSTHSPGRSFPQIGSFGFQSISNGRTAPLVPPGLSIRR